jgi:hypothetical protein
MTQPKPIASLSEFPPAEWDFQFFIAREKPSVRELYYCLTYESARKIPSIIDLFNHEQKIKSKAFDANGSWHFLLEEKFRVVAPIGFPHTPFFLLPKELRQKVSPPLPKKVELLSFQSDLLLNNQREAVALDEAICFRINRQMGRTQIKKEVNSLLDSVLKKHTGRSKATSLRKELRCLSAYRLYKLFCERYFTFNDHAKTRPLLSKITFEKLKKSLDEERKKDGKDVGYVYAERCEWSGAIKRVEKRLALICASMAEIEVRRRFNPALARHLAETEAKRK